MGRFLEKINALIEAFCNFFFAIIVVFTLILLMSPLFHLLEGHAGFGWILLTIVVMGIVYFAVSIGANYVFDVLDRIRKGELLVWFFSPLRNISSVVGIYAAFKVVYFLIHSKEAPSASSWEAFLWEFLTKL